MTLAQLVKAVLGFFFVVIPLGILVLTGYILWSGSTADVKAQYQLVAADILVPMYGAVLATLAATAAIKGITTVADNARKLAANRSDLTQIKLFDW